MFVKICGITSEEDALLAVAMGADAVGFVFAPSPRQVAAGLVRDIVRRLPPEVLTVGVFRDESAQRVVDIVNGTGLRAAQLHGLETAEQTAWVRKRVPFVIKAFAAGDPALERADDFGADAILVDSHAPGSGEVFDWSLAEGAPLNRRVILAGGLTPENVAEAIEAVRPWGVDVSTGVESSPGPQGRAQGAGVRHERPPCRAAALPGRRRGSPVRLAGGGPVSGADARVMGEPTPEGRFGRFGGRFVPETLVPACAELERAFRSAWGDPAFRAELDGLLRDYAGRPSPLTECKRLSDELGVRVLLKREDLNHTGSHKINNVLGQALLARRMGKTRSGRRDRRGPARRRDGDRRRAARHGVSSCTWARSTCGGKR